MLSLFIFLLKLFLLWPLGTIAGWSLCPGDMINSYLCMEDGDENLFISETTSHSKLMFPVPALSLSSLGSCHWR